MIFLLLILIGFVYGVGREYGGRAAFVVGGAIFLLLDGIGPVVK